MLLLSGNVKSLEIKDCGGQSKQLFYFIENTEEIRNKSCMPIFMPKLCICIDIIVSRHKDIVIFTSTCVLYFRF